MKYHVENLVGENWFRYTQKPFDTKAEAEAHIEYARGVTGDNKTSLRITAITDKEADRDEVLRRIRDEETISIDMVCDQLTHRQLRDLLKQSDMPSEPECL